MWTTDVGRYAASNYATFKAIFEANPKLFNQMAKKTILFVLRDFDNRGNNFERITGILTKDLEKIWTEIHKPEQFASSVPTDFF
jgi:hypothetical protein